MEKNNSLPVVSVHLFYDIDYVTVITLSSIIGAAQWDVTIFGEMSQRVVSPMLILFKLLISNHGCTLTGSTVGIPRETPGLDGRLWNITASKRNKSS